MSLILLALATLSSFICLNFLSTRFIEIENNPNLPIIQFVIIYIFIGLCYFLFVTRFRKHITRIKSLIILIFIIGFIARALMIFSVPILEVDFYRYLWDGGVLANGYNPYKYAPDTFISADSKDHIPQNLVILGKKNNHILNNINHPQLKTAYPPVAELTFALAHIIKPFSLISWKFVLLFFDIVTFILLFILLKKLKIPESNLIIYWLNPLLIKETFNSGHMDVIVFPILIGAFLLLLSKRYNFSFIALSAAVGVKLWPVLLFPVFIRNFISGWKKFLKYFSIFSLSTLVLLLPMIYSYFYQTSGIEAYSRSWQNNDLFFRIILVVTEFILPLIGYHSGHGQFLSRILIVLILIIVVLYFNRVKAKDNLDYIKKSLVIISFAFFLSPTQFPWYYLWLLPFLTIIPYKPLLLLTVLMPLYYLRYYFEPRGQYDLYYDFIVWLEYLPVLSWILYDLIKRKKLKALSGF